MIPPRAQEAAEKLEADRHNGRYNIAFCDGHIDQIKSGPLFDKDPSMKRRWNYDHEPH